MPSVARDRVEAALWRHGRWVGNRAPNDRLPSLHRFRLPAAIAELAHPASPRRFVVARDKVTTPYGFGFGTVGWHPYVATLAEYEELPQLAYEDSVLARFHDLFAPETLGMALAGDPRDVPLQSIAARPHSWALLRDLWLLNPATVDRLVVRAASTRVEKRCPHVGPYGREAGEETFRRLVNVFESLRQQGYDPLRFEFSDATGFDGYGADGYFLWDGDDYRFVLLHGHHRLGAAAHLGVSQVHVSARRRYVPVIWRSELDDSGLANWLDPESKRRVFDLLFGETGLRKARAWGLMGNPPSPPVGDTP